MVRRRTRAAKDRGLVGADGGVVGSGATTAAASLELLTAASLLDDQYFASPKRKDCKIDSCLSTSLEMAVERKNSAQGKSPTSPTTMGKTRGERAGSSGRIIGVPLATRSQTRTIETFFKANSAKQQQQQHQQHEEQSHHKVEDDGASVECPASPGSPYQAIELPQMQADFFYDLCDDTNDTDNTELSDGAASSQSHTQQQQQQAPLQRIDFASHRTNSLRDSNSSGCSVLTSTSSSCSSTSSSNTDNIFLQEPVLSLNVDKSANLASSIKINTSLEIEPIFSSPPQLSTAYTLNGRFNQIVSLNTSGGAGGSPVKSDVFGFAVAARPALSDTDNSSCDSGIAVPNTMECASPLVINGQVAGVARRRKPATPHRILCPSPVKAVPRVVSPAAVAAVAAALSPSGRKKDHLISPRKSPRAVGMAVTKTRRRLNTQKAKGLQQPAAQPTQQRLTEEVLQSGSDQKLQVTSHSDDGEEMENSGESEGKAIKCLFGPKSAILMYDDADRHDDLAEPMKPPSINKMPAKSKPVGKLPAAAATQPKTKSQVAPQPLSTTNGNREMTDFFPVRRSVRKTKTAVKEEMMRNLEQAVLEERAEGLKIAHFEGKGRGVIADRNFERGEFVVEYVGDLISMSEAAEREKRYALDENAGCYMYYFKHKNQQYCIDATVDTGKLGRLVNHSRTGNLITKVVVVKQRPHLILIAKDNIEAGEELTYDYGDRSKESLLHHPWLAF